MCHTIGAAVDAKVRVARKAAWLRHRVAVRRRAEVHGGAAAVQQPALPPVDGDLLLQGGPLSSFRRSRAAFRARSTPHKLPLLNAPAARQHFYRYSECSVVVSPRPHGLRKSDAPFRHCLSGGGAQLVSDITGQACFTTQGALRNDTAVLESAAGLIRRCGVSQFAAPTVLVNQDAAAPVPGTQQARICASTPKNCRRHWKGKLHLVVLDAPRPLPVLSMEPSPDSATRAAN